MRHNNHNVRNYDERDAFGEGTRMDYYGEQGPTIKRAAIYLRISQERSGTKTYASDAIERQREDCMSMCEWYRWEIVATYVDKAKSAYDESHERPEFERMLADYRAGKFDIIVGWKLDRILRRVGSLVDMVREAPDMRFCTEDLGIIDLTNPDGKRRAIDAANNAEFESARKGERERRANRQHAEQGRPKRAPKRCWGYTVDREIVPEEAAVVRELYAARVAGYPLHDLLRAMNGEETVNPLTELKRAISRLPETQKWTYTRLRYCLANPKYAGFIAHIEEPIGSGPRRQRAAIVADALVRDRDGNLVRGNWEPIVDEATWRKSVSMMKKNLRGQRQTGKRRYFGTGIFRCGVCGRPLYVADSSYRCSQKGHVSRLREPIDRLVLATIRERLGREDLATLLPRQDTGRLAEIADELRAVDGDLARIRDDYTKKHIDGEFYHELHDGYVAQRDALLTERDALTGTDPTGGVLTCDDPVAAFDALADDPVRLHSIVDYLVTVTIHPFHRNRKRGQRTFNFEGIDIEWKEH